MPSAPTRRRRSLRSTSSVGALHRSRLKRLRALIRSRGFDAILVTNPNDISYISGFCGEASYAVVTAEDFWIISDSRFTEELRPFRRFASIVIRTGPITDEAGRVLGDVRARAIALQSEYMTVAVRSALTKLLGVRRLRDTSGLLASLRIVKDDSELAAIRRAAGIQQDALKAVLPTIRPGQSEGSIAARLEFEMKSRGASGTSFDTIVASGPNSAKPHYRAGPAKAARGKPLLIDWGAKSGGYCSDMTRTFALGRWPAKLADLYKVVLEAHLAGIAAVRPGRTGHEVDQVARRVLTQAGYAALIGHNLGHGIGLDIHEDPRLAKGSAQVLEPGMVVTVEPGLYLPGVGGVRIEDDILVTQDGGENICSLPKDLHWATLHG